MSHRQSKPSKASRRAPGLKICGKAPAAKERQSPSKMETQKIHETHRNTFNYNHRVATKTEFTISKFSCWLDTRNSTVIFPVILCESEVDEFLFAALTPMSIHLAIQKLEAVKVKYTQRRNKVESLLLFLLLAITFIVPYFLLLAI